LSFDTLFRLGWNARWTALFAPHQDAGLVPGRVIRVDRDRVTVKTPTGDVVAVARNLPAAGDWVALADGRVSAVLPRSSALVRRDPDRPVPQVMAANVDVAFVVAPLDPAANLRRLERTLAVVWDGGAVPVVVLTKPDRCPDVAAQVAAVEAVALGVVVAVVNGVTGEGVDSLRLHLADNRTAVFIGPSGAGKSTLVNLLVGEERLATRAVREDDRKGRHTTTARHLLTVPMGGVLIDTPGIRELAIWEAADGMASAFADIDELAAGCRFRDCRHAAEPGCAVIGRVDDGRLRNWRQLSDPIDPAERRRRGKIAQKAYRRDFKG
jgi:ribosome biogenesis GTPase